MKGLFRKSLMLKLHYEPQNDPNLLNNLMLLYNEQNMAKHLKMDSVTEEFIKIFLHDSQLVFYYNHNLPK